MQASIERLTDELVKIGMGERQPEHMVTVERQLRPSRSRSQELLLLLFSSQRGQEGRKNVALREHAQGETHHPRAR